MLKHFYGKKTTKKSMDENNDIDDWQELECITHTKLDNLEKKVNILEEKVDRINEILMENRQLYTDYITQNHMITKKVVQLLEENRNLYLNALTELELKEDQAFNEIKPMLEKVSQQNIDIRAKMNEPFLTERFNNRNWRTNNNDNIGVLNNNFLGILPYQCYKK